MNLRAITVTGRPFIRSHCNIMETADRNYYITTPIYYVNAHPHLGHAYSTILADAAVRLHRELGADTLLLTGSDEHGDKIAQAAEKRGMAPKLFVDEISSSFRDLWPKLSIKYDTFTRTTDAAHVAIVQKFLQRIYDAGDIYFGEFGGHYCYGCERFYTEKELENGLCPQHQTKPQFISEKNYFFRMSAYLPWLREFLENNPDLIRPTRYRAEAMAMLENGVLEDLCISRPKSRLTWGIELPFDQDYVCYVWFDALVSYISGIGWPDGSQFERFWPGEHLIAKDILKPHAIFWPCMLKAAGLPIYRHLDVHGYWLSRDTKMSKSLGNVIDPLAMAQKYGLDAFRYFLLREMRFGSDASFSEEGITTRINADLANDLGNLFSRVLSMAAKYLDSTVPAMDGINSDDSELAEPCRETMANYIQLAERMEFSLALENLWQFVRSLNKYVDTQAPWSLYKNKELDKLHMVMGGLLAAMRKIAICLWPVMPDAAEKMLAQLGCESRLGPDMPLANIEKEQASFEWLPAGLKLAPSSNLFPRMEASPKNAPASDKKDKDAADTPKIEHVDFDTFKKLDIRVGTIVHAGKHPNADRILKLEIDFGPGGKRQILSGLAEAYNPADIIGRKICAVLNLPPRKIRGLVSEGMVLTAEDDNSLTLLAPDAKMSNGSIIG